MRVMGFDPGKTGGMACIGDGANYGAEMPLIGKELDIRRIRDTVAEHKPDIVIIELVASMPKQGVASTFTFGKNFGQLLGLMEGMSQPYRLVRPQEWKSVVLKGTAKDKDAAVAFVYRAYPDIDLTPGRKRVAHDGIADAVCLAEYGLRCCAF